MTEKDLALLTYLDRYIRARGIAPTFDEIGHSIGIKGRGGVHHRLTRLETQGLIERVHGSTRGIRILHSPLADRERERMFDAAGALLEACELQQQLIARMLQERFFPVFQSDRDLLDAATDAATRALALAKQNPPAPSVPADPTGDNAHA